MACGKTDPDMTCSRYISDGGQAGRWRVVHPLVLGLLLGIWGCATAPPLDNPLPLAMPVVAECAAVENPVLVSPGMPTPEAYREVFERVVDILSDYFELLPPNPYDGRVVTRPRIAPGYEQFWKPGNPDPRSRLLATFQTVRQRAVAEIRAGERGGYWVLVVVERELEDLPRPTQARIGNPIFQEGPTVERRLEVVSPDHAPEQGWFAIGRDYALEQQILRRIRQGR
ncbi:MAG: hypothetical protein NZU63_02570 [Gemmataceae bacterium]|nr:hypothetical protein [Gemmataceae bacterium]MDW8242683.1 hypothetical protein [Thermogemmata sp.]